ncbi:MAG: GNAT family N-acetyltransferase [Methylotenera sp.]|nr:GNAT family N-acetyltransferase [Methylotenera sp.]
MILIEVTDNGGNIIELDWLIKAELVHRQLRPLLPADYVARMRQVFANGARLLLAVNDDQIVGVALWRLIENTYEGLRLYVDDLVTDENERSKGIGKSLLQHLEAKARDFGCSVLTLDSGVQRTSAHKFYFREGMHIPSFCFRKSL